MSTSGDLWKEACMLERITPLFALVCVVVSELFLPPTYVLADEASVGFDGKSNGLVSDAIHTADQNVFEEVEGIADGLGPVYNASSCVACHANPITGGASQITELRVGHLEKKLFVNPVIPLGTTGLTVLGRSLVNDRTICPNGQDSRDVQERVPDSETSRTLRISLNLLGDGFVEAVADETLVDLANDQCSAGGKDKGNDNGKGPQGKDVCGQVVRVPILESPGATGVGRFGWKNQHTSLRSFAADAYLNEMGITSQLMPNEVTTLCDGAATHPNNLPDSNGVDDVARFAEFMRATKAPARDAALAATSAAIRGSAVFDQVGCATCHVRNLTTAPAGTMTHPAFTVPAALGNKTFHPFSDFLLHDVGTGDGIVQSGDPGDDSTRSKLRTAPLWGLRLRPRLMHDAASLTLTDAILRHDGEAKDSIQGFRKLSADDQNALRVFLQSL
jgi:CxxC motif-containing protein (DUF1111 family)